MLFVLIVCSIIFYIYQIFYLKQLSDQTALPLRSHCDLIFSERRQVAVQIAEFLIKDQSRCVHTATMAMLARPHGALTALLLRPRCVLSRPYGVHCATVCVVTALSVRATRCHGAFTARSLRCHRAPSALWFLSSGMRRWYWPSFARLLYSSNDRTQSLRVVVTFFVAVR